MIVALLKRGQEVRGFRLMPAQSLRSAGRALASAVRAVIEGVNATWNGYGTNLTRQLRLRLCGWAGASVLLVRRRFRSGQRIDTADFNPGNLETPRLGSRADHREQVIVDVVTGR